MRLLERLLSTHGLVALSQSCFKLLLIQSNFESLLITQQMFVLLVKQLHGVEAS